MAPPSEPGAFAWGVSLPEEMHPSALVRDYRCGAVLGQGDPPHDAANRVGPCDGSVHTVHDLHLARPDDAHPELCPVGAELEVERGAVERDVANPGARDEAPDVHRIRDLVRDVQLGSVRRDGDALRMTTDGKRARDGAGLEVDLLDRAALYADVH